MTEHEVQLEEAARAAERERLRDIESMREDAIAENQRSWRGMLFSAADSLVEGTVYAIGFGVCGISAWLTFFGFRISTGFLLLFAGVPLGTFTLLIALIAVPLHGSDSDRHRRYTNIAVVVWVVVTLIFLIGFLYGP
jgi:hypothetical protein